MDRRDARLAVDLARQWAREGLLPATSLATLERRHAADARDDPDRESFGASVLYGLGGVLLGAAVFALLVLLQDRGTIATDRVDDVAPWLFLAWGAACAAAAFALDLAARKPRLGDALHVAALVAVTAAPLPGGRELALGLLAMAFAGAVGAYRRLRFLVPLLAVVAFNAAFTAVLFEGDVLRDEEDAFAAWFGFALVQAAALTMASRRTPWPWPALSLGGATLLVAGTFVGWYADVRDGLGATFQGDVEVYLAILMGAALATGLALREKGLVLAAALVLAIDAIVFAFDVGDLVGGLASILAVAGLLIWQAGNLRRYLREA